MKQLITNPSIQHTKHLSNNKFTNNLRIVLYLYDNNLNPKYTIIITKYR